LSKVQAKLQSFSSRRRIAGVAAEVAQREPKAPAQKPVAFFNASARLGHLSLNAAYSLLASWGLRMEGVPVVHFVCNSGMSRCVLGTNPDDASQAPPCASCVSQSKRLYAKSDISWFSYSENDKLAKDLAKLNLESLQAFSFDGQPLGEIVLPALRWALRRHHLEDDEDTRFLYRQYILSAYNVDQQFASFLDEHSPQAVVLFNGTMYPEAMARRIAKERGIRVITHEVGLRPFSAFFTEGEATAYPMEIPNDFQLSKAQNAELDAYLEQRFQGKFTMAGIQFWPEMQALDAAFLARAETYKKIVPIFTNVIFDTSQVHANTLYPHMFAWLDDLLAIMKAQSDTLFVIRAHPDEMRPNSRKQSRESVRQWVIEKKVDRLPNVSFVDSGDYLSSYALIQRAHFVMVYNSSIGLEASIMGRPVLSAGAARYTHFPTVYYPDSRNAFVKKAKSFLSADTVEQPAEFVREARRVLYFQLYRTALLFEDYLEAHERMGYTKLKSFSPDALLAENSPAMKAILEGVVRGKNFLV
jgi:capsule polysaccharide modification protein KpsS